MAEVITLPPRNARRAPPPKTPNHDWLQEHARQFMRATLAEAAPASAPGLAETLAILHRIEAHLAKLSTTYSLDAANPGHHNRDPLNERRLP